MNAQDNAKDFDPELDADKEIGANNAANNLYDLKPEGGTKSRRRGGPGMGRQKFKRGKT